MHFSTAVWACPGQPGVAEQVAAPTALSLFLFLNSFWRPSQQLWRRKAEGCSKRNAAFIHPLKQTPWLPSLAPFPLKEAWHLKKCGLKKRELKLALSSFHAVSFSWTEIWFFYEDYLQCACGIAPTSTSSISTYSLMALKFPLM